MWKDVNEQNIVKHENVNVHHLKLDLSRPAKFSIEIQCLDNPQAQAYSSLFQMKITASVTKSLH